MQEFGVTKIKSYQNQKSNTKIKRSKSCQTQAPRKFDGRECCSKFVKVKLAKPQ